MSRTLNHTRICPHELPIRNRESPDSFGVPSVAKFLCQEDRMLEQYFSAPKTLRRLRLGPSGLYIDGFAGALAADGYSYSNAVRYLRIAAHLGQYQQKHGAALAALTPATLVAFR